MRSLPNELSIESSYSWLVAAFSLLIASLSFGAVMALPILMKPMEESLQWTRSSLSLAHALAMAGAGFMGLVIGRLADRYSFAPFSLIGGIAIGLGLWASSRVSSPWQLYTFYPLLVGAIGQGTFFGPITVNASRWFDRNRALAMAIVLCGQGLGGLVAPIVLRMLAENLGWRDAMAFYGLVCSFLIVGLSVIFLCAPAALNEFSRVPLSCCSVPGRTALRIWANASSALFFLNTGSFIVITHIVAYGEEAGLSPVASASLLTALLGSTLISRIAGGVIVDRINPHNVIWFFVLAIIFGVLSIVVTDKKFVYMGLGAIIFGLGYGAIFPAFASLVRRVFPVSVAGTWISAMFLFAFIAAACGSWLGGAIRDQLDDYVYAFVAATILACVSLMLSYNLVRRKP
ncbi:MFS transporter [Ectothiorhodospiraceae bacterium WFHF3C12]|nr:MFS transporter [Ectothiorhodospiraceae bacterium WFHF3C12]